MMTRRSFRWIMWRGEDFTVGAATFEIVIKGTLSDPIAALIDGFQVSRIEHGETHLVGPMPDQARLQGILTLFGNLNIEIVSVNPVPKV
jgi:hypothetical protein